MRLAGAVVVAAATTLLLPAAQAAEQKPASPVLGVQSAKHGLLRLAWFDPLTLQTLRTRKPPLGATTESWSLSPDGSRLAIATQQSVRTPRPGLFAPQLWFVNLRTMRVLGEVDVGEGAMFHTITWLRPDRLLAVTIGSPAAVVVVDPVQRTVIRRVPLPGFPASAARLADGIALLLRSEGSFAPAVVAVVDANGELRTVSLDRIEVGLVRASDTSYQIKVPGFAVDAATRRAFVVGDDFTVAEVDLDSLAVAYHTPVTRSLASSRRTVKGPISGWWRYALWLGNGLLAVSGGNNPSGGTAAIPVGLRLIDTRDWHTRVVDSDTIVIWFAPGAQVFLANAATALGYLPGTAVYGLDGTLRYRFERTGRRWLAVYGQYGYVCVGTSGGVVLRVFDALSGRTFRIPAAPRPSCGVRLLYGHNW